MSGLRAMPRLPFFRLLVPRMSRASPILPLNTSSPSSRIQPIRLTTSSSSRIRGYTPLAQDSPPGSPGADGESEAKLPLTTRLKVLIKSYGWYALGVYFALTVVDFSIAFAAINLLGAAQVGRATAYVKNAVMDMVHRAGVGLSSDESPDGSVNGRESASGGAGGSEGLYAMILLAYTVHKTLFMPIRIGLTMAITPKLVRWLRMRGFTGQGGATRAAEHLRQSMRRRGDRTD